MERIVKNINTDELFIETDILDFTKRLERWYQNNKAPCPMPSGHLMFRYPSDYDCILVDSNLE